MPITTEKGKPKRVFICNNCGWEGSFKELATLIADEDGAAFKGCPRCRDDSGEYGKDLKLVLKPTSGRA